MFSSKIFFSDDISYFSNKFASPMAEPDQNNRLDAENNEFGSKIIRSILNDFLTKF